MEFLKLASERYSVRDFSPRSIEEEKIDLILKAAQVAPTAVNYQPQRIYVIQSAEGMAKLSGMRNMFGAPMAILVCYDRNESWKNKKDNCHDSGEVDASIVTTHMMLQAWELGIGSCWIGSFSPSEVQQAYGIPENEVSVSILAIGYPSDTCQPGEKHLQSKKLDEFVKYI